MNNEAMVYRRVVLQIDAASHCLDTITMASEIAARLDAELRGVFVEDNDLLSAGGLEFVREISLSSATARHFDRPALEAQLNAMARSARRKLAQEAAKRDLVFAFQTIRGDRQRGLKEIAGEKDLIITEGTGRLHRRSFKAPFTSLEAQWDRTTLMLKGGGQLSNQIVIICCDVDEARRALQAVGSISLTNDRQVMLLPVASGIERGRNLRQGLAALVKSSPTDVTIADGDITDHMQVMKRLGPKNNLVVLSDHNPLLLEQGTLRLLCESAHPLLIVRSPH
jgi:nucleotide-binding universal stress UspA family protein